LVLSFEMVKINVAGSRICEFLRHSIIDASERHSVTFYFALES